MELIMNCQLEFPENFNVSKLAKDFCSKLLRKASDNRLNAEDALKHPFILVF